MSAKVPSQLEPLGLLRSDGKRPDGITIILWSRGQLLVWDATCCDIFTASYIGAAVSEPGAAAKAEENKVSKYCHLDACYQFVPVAVETCGTFGPQVGEFFRELGRQVRRATLEPNAYQYLVQRISVAVRRGNAASVLTGQSAQCFGGLVILFCLLCFVVVIFVFVYWVLFVLNCIII